MIRYICLSLVILSFNTSSIYAGVLPDIIISCNFQLQSMGKSYNGYIEVNDLLDVKFEVKGKEHKLLSCHYQGKLATSDQSASRDLLIDWEKSPCDLESNSIKQLDRGFLRLSHSKPQTAVFLNFYGPGPIQCSPLRINEFKLNKIIKQILR